MKPFIEVAGGNHLPVICYAQRGGMAYLGDYAVSDFATHAEPLRRTETSSARVFFG